MRRHRPWLGAIVLSGMLVLGACSKSSSSTTAAASTSAPAATTATTAPSSPVQGANPGGDFCTLLKAEKAKVAQLGKTIGSAFATNDFATTKQNLTAYLAAVAAAIGAVEVSMADAPANVQAALKTVNTFFAQLQTAVSSASTLTELQTNMSTAANTSELKKAGAVLKAYTTSQCGNLGT